MCHRVRWSVTERSDFYITMTLLNLCPGRSINTETDHQNIENGYSKPEGGSPCEGRD